MTSCDHFQAGGCPSSLSRILHSSTSTLKNHRSDAALSLAGVTSRKRGTEARPYPLTTTRRVLIKITVVLPRDASIRQEHRHKDNAYVGVRQSNNYLNTPAAPG